MADAIQSPILRNGKPKPPRKVRHAVAPLIECDRLKTLLSYDPITGIFIRISCRQRPDLVGEQAGGINRNGKSTYIQIYLDGRNYHAHVLAWFWMTGSWPTVQVDHEDCDGTNNRWDNLRQASQSQNNANQRLSVANTSGYKGVHWNSHAGKWAASIQRDGTSHHIGYFIDPQKAHAAYLSKAKEFFGEFARAV